MDEKGVTTWESAAQAADSYSLLVRRLGKTESQGRGSRSSSDNTHGTGSGISRGPHNQSNNNSSVLCTYCKKPGHTISQCKHPNRKFSHRGSVENRTYHSKKPVSTCNSPSSSQILQSFIQTGHVSLGKANTSSPIIILRDTAAAQSVLFKDALPNVDSSLTGEKVLLTDLSTATAYPLASVYLKCSLLVGKVQVAIKETPLPVPGVNVNFQPSRAVQYLWFVTTQRWVLDT